MKLKTNKILFVKASNDPSCPNELWESDCNINHLQRYKESGVNQMNKSYYVRPAEMSGPTSHVCCCGRCGKRVLADNYNIQEHEQTCNLKTGVLQAADSQARSTDEIVIVEEKNSWGYLLESKENDVSTYRALTLSICIPILNRIPDYTNRYSGMEWMPVFVAVFDAGIKTPQILRNDTEYEMEDLLLQIKEGRINQIGIESDRDVIRRVFPGIIDVYSLQMFVHIYQDKGFSTDVSINSGTESWLFENTPNSREWKRLGVYEEKKDDSTWSLDYHKCKVNLRTGDVPAKNVRRPTSIYQKGKTAIYAALFKHRNDRYILQVVLKKDQEKIVFLFTRGYGSCSKEVDLSDVLGQEYYLVGNSMMAIEQFDKIYPEYHLVMYAKRSQNILIPLLAAEYHIGMELSAKAGATAIAENYSKLSVFKKSPCLMHNLKDIFGVPVSVLRTLSRDQVNNRALARLKAIYKYQPAFLNFDTYTDSMMEFYIRGDITHKGMSRVRDIEGISDLSDKQILQILRYLEKNPHIGHYYCDYMNACAQLGDYEYGITPSIPIRVAHDRVVARIKNKQDIETRKAFKSVVTSHDYLKLTTGGYEQEDREFAEESYLVMAPESSDDLFRESESMHNCVRIYVPNVVRHSARIYFLRSKEAPDKSFGTIEVSGDGRKLIQAKAFGNRKLPREAQKFVIKWCRCKGITIDTGDITELY